MSTSHFIECWNENPHTAIEICQLLKNAMPSAPIPSEEQAADMFKFMIGEYKDCALMLRENGSLIGFLMLFTGPSKNIARLSGAVKVESQNKGYGTHLWQTMLQKLSQYPEVTQLQTPIFQSLPNSKAYIEKRGFYLADRVFWQERPVDSPLDVDLRKKYSSHANQSIKILRASEFRKIRPDWQHAWWAFEVKAIQDIPSKVPVSVPPFEEWCKYTEKFKDQGYSLLAVDGSEPVGIIKLGEVKEEKLNINFTAVAATHRRQGISTLLKLQALAYAKEQQAKILSTQNHENNEAIVSANRYLGFEQTNVILDYIYDLPQS